MNPFERSPRYVFKRWDKRLAAACLDALGSLVTFPARWLRSPLDPKKLKRILLIRIDPLGDVIMTWPAISALHRRFPQCEIDLLVSDDIRPLFEDAREIREALGFKNHWFSKHANLRALWDETRHLLKELRRRRYDLAIDFRGDLRNIFLMWLARIPLRLGYGMTGGGFLLTEKGEYSILKHQVDLNLSLVKELGAVADDDHPVAFPYSSQRKTKFWGRFGARLAPSPLPRIVLHPGAGYPSKQWPQKKYRELIEKIRRENLGQIVLIGSEEEKRAAPDLAGGEGILDLRGMTRLSDLPILFDACDLFLGNDSGPSHLAAAQGLPVIVLFSGTNRYEAWHPWTDRLYGIRYEVPCSPCEASLCPLGHHDCMKKIMPDEVFAKVKFALHHQSSRAR